MQEQYQKTGDPVFNVGDVSNQWSEWMSPGWESGSDKKLKDARERVAMSLMSRVYGQTPGVALSDVQNAQANTAIKGLNTLAADKAVKARSTYDVRRYLDNVQADSGKTGVDAAVEQSELAIKKQYAPTWLNTFSLQNGGPALERNRHPNLSDDQWASLVRSTRESALLSQSP